MGEVGDVGCGAELGEIGFGVGDVCAVESGCGGAGGVLVRDAEEGVLRLMDLAEAEVGEELLPDLLSGFVQGRVGSGVVVRLRKVEVPSDDGVDVVGEGERGGELFALKGEMVALASGKIEVDELKGEELVGGGGEGFKEERADPTLCVNAVLDVEVSAVGLVDCSDEAFAVVGAVVVEDDVVGKGVFEGEEVVGVEVGLLDGDDVVIGCDGFDVVDDVTVARAGGGSGVVG